jgi:hypothetical protein
MPGLRQVAHIQTRNRASGNNDFRDFSNANKATSRTGDKTGCG